MSLYLIGQKNGLRMEKVFSTPETQFAFEVLYFNLLKFFSSRFSTYKIILLHLNIESFLQYTENFLFQKNEDWDGLICPTAGTIGAKF